MTINFRVYPNIKNKTLFLKNKEKLTLGRFIVSYRKYLKETNLFNRFNKHKLVIQFNSLNITPNLLQKKVYKKLKNAHNKSIN